MIVRLLVCRLAILCSLAISAGSMSAQVVIDVDPEPAIAGQPLVVRGVDDGRPIVGAEVMVETGPSSQLAKVVTVGELSTRGSLIVVPERPGLVRLTLRNPVDGTELARRDLAVHAPTVPIGAVAVLGFAGLLLFGGIRVGLGERGPSRPSGDHASE